MRGMYCTSTVPCAFVYASNDSIKIYSAIKNTCYSNCKRCFCLFVVMILLFSYVVNDVSLGKHFQLTDFLLNNMLFQHIVQHDVAICCQFLPISAIEKRGPPKTHLPPASSGPHFRVSDMREGHCWSVLLPHIHVGGLHAAHHVWACDLNSIWRILAFDDPQQRKSLPDRLAKLYFFCTFSITFVIPAVRLQSGSSSNPASNPRKIVSGLFQLEARIPQASQQCFMKSLPETSWNITGSTDCFFRK